MKLYIVAKIKKKHTAKIEHISLGFNVIDPELIEEILAKNSLTLYTEKEMVDIKSRISAANEIVKRMTSGNFTHKLGNLKMILNGI